MTEVAAGPPASDQLVPGWLRRLAAIGWRLLAAIALVLVLLYIAVELATVTTSILIAAIVAATFAPYVLELRHRGWSRIKAAAAVFLGAAFVILGTLIVLGLAFLPYVGQVVTAMGDGLTALEAKLADLSVPPGVGLAVDVVVRGVHGWLATAASGIAAVSTNSSSAATPTTASARLMANTTS